MRAPLRLCTATWLVGNRTYGCQPWLWPATPYGLVAPAKGLASGSHPCKWPGRRWPPLQAACPQVAAPILVPFTMNRSKNGNSSRFNLIIRSLKTNLCTNNLGTDTTIGKPQ
ncbi:hypothetical protein GW17_00053382 [Ensete ventricosum]|nr:hypothetical protein GW17_00053382 [Ensete ventricosum]RZS05970.1 hypothetical protein BHM03_00036554 [Ensete ventricosum]